MDIIKIIVLYTINCIFFQALSIEGQDSVFGQDNSVASAQSSQPQLSESEKLDDSIDNQQQVCLVNAPLPE